MGLNPSFRGIWFRGQEKRTERSSRSKVLTLLFVEFGFGADGLGVGATFTVCLNPSFRGIWFRGRWLGRWSDVYGVS